MCVVLGPYAVHLLQKDVGRFCKFRVFAFKEIFTLSRTSLVVYHVYDAHVLTSRALRYSNLNFQSHEVVSLSRYRDSQL